MDRAAFICHTTGGASAVCGRYVGRTIIIQIFVKKPRTADIQNRCRSSGISDGITLKFRFEDDKPLRKR